MLTGVVPSYIHQGRLRVYPQGQCQKSQIYLYFPQDLQHLNEKCCQIADGQLLRNCPKNRAKLSFPCVI